MKPKFREDKVTQVATLFLKMGGGKMNHLKLMKLLYLADREALVRWGRPIVYDSYVSMNQGPVLSQTLDLIHGDSSATKFWNKCISPTTNFEVSLLVKSETSKLSRAEEKLIDEIFAKFKHLDQWQLVEYTHGLPEYQDPKGSSIPISYEKVLKGAGRTDIDITSIVDEIDNIGSMDNLMCS